MRDQVQDIKEKLQVDFPNEEGTNEKVIDMKGREIKLNVWTIWVTEDQNETGGTKTIFTDTIEKNFLELIKRLVLCRLKSAL